ncbi:FUSC family protein [Stomatohabitans albus]|uniref:FUSC family protein n=1 Tax=Stomatohabitans albus TaxID=3110766 RepID=UPI00300D9FAB
MNLPAWLDLKPHIRGVFGFQTSNRGWYTAFKCGVAVGLPVLIGQALGDPIFGLLAFTGSFSSQYGFGASGRLRVRLMVGASVFLVMATLVGWVTAGIPGLTILAMATTAFLATLTATTFKIGPPAAFYMVMAVGLTNRLIDGGVDPWRLLGAVCVGAVIGVAMGLSDLLFDRFGPERQAVEDAETCIESFATNRNPKLASSMQQRCAAAVNDAWTMVTDAGWAVESYDRKVEHRTLDKLGHRLLAVHSRYLRIVSALATGEGLSDGNAMVLPRRHTRETSLGRPGIGTMIAGALTWPSEPLLIAMRNWIGVSLAGLIGLSLGPDRINWPAAFTVLMLHTGGSRVGQTHRSIQRLIGTFLGVGLYTLLAMWNPQGVWLAVVLAVSQALTTYLLPRNYAVAVAPITAMTMLIVAHASGLAPAHTFSVVLIQDRLVDNTISVVSALIVVWLTFRHTSVAFLRAYARRVVEAAEQVLDDLALGRQETRRARRDRQALYITLLEADMVAKRAMADDDHKGDPNAHGANAYASMTQALQTFGYQVLGYCWAPDPIDRSPFIAAGDALSSITNRAVRRPRTPDELESDIVAARDHLDRITYER